MFGMVLNAVRLFSFGGMVIFKRFLILMPQSLNHSIRFDTIELEKSPLWTPPSVPHQGSVAGEEGGGRKTKTEVFVCR